jgi:ATP-dependent Clp protease ATP-binding subunit ClpA
MEPDLSVQLTWPLAAQEAIQGSYEFIEPVHLFMAALKFAELEKAQLSEVAGDEGVLKALLAERDQLRSVLHERSVTVPEKSRPIRRGLRKQLRGDHPHDGKKVIHRSTEARLVCGKAEEVARSADSPRWSTAHLLQAILEAPTKEIEDILVASGLTRTKVLPPTPHLDRYGRNLSVDISTSEGEATKDPVCKVLVEGLLADVPKSFLLIRKGKRSPESIVESLAGYLAGSGARVPAGKCKTIIEIDLGADAWRCVIGDPLQTRKAMDEVLTEAGQTRDVILFFKELPQFIGRDELRGSESMRQWLSRGGCCIGGIDEQGYREHFEKDRNMKKLFQVVWVHDLDDSFCL